MDVQLLYWFLLSVVVALAHWFVGILFWRGAGRQVPFRELVKDGSLLFFSTALAGQSLGQYLQQVPVSQNALPSVVAIAGLPLIIMPTMDVYGDLAAALASRATPRLPAGFLANFSYVLAVTAVS